MSKRILITGVQGLIGWNLYNDLASDYQLFGFSTKVRDKCISKAPKHKEWYEGLVEDYEGFSSVIEDTQPDIVIHAQAMCNLDLCEDKPDKTELVNVEATRQLIRALNPDNHRLIYMSTEHVFSGNKGNYAEDDEYDPISVYGRTKVEAEQLVKDYPGFLIIRPGLVVGGSMQGNIGARDWLKSRLTKNQPATYFTDEIRSPIHSSDFSKGMKFLIDQEAQGIYHLGGKDSYSRYELAQLMAKQLDMTGNICSKTIKSDKIVPRIANCTLNSQKAANLGWPTPNFQ
ncbi:MAG: dTDP-4-dehydrorhamnose reductase [Candidatus Omnitrophota bacterium]|jgi:dTDP-4-dehydrorhamnose reductase